MFNSLRHFRRRQQGLTLMEVLISLSIIAMATIGLNAIADRFAQDAQDSLMASQVRIFGDAAKAYIKDNYTTVMSTATPTTPVLIHGLTLTSSGKLPVGYNWLTAYRQNICALVLQPSPGRLQAMVVTEGGRTIDDSSLGNIASAIGGSGGAIYSTDAYTIRGSSASWMLPVSTFDNLTNVPGWHCDGTPGKVSLAVGHPAMALWFENGDTSASFVYRDAVPGRPELNTMNTPLQMNSVQTVGAACTTGQLARDATGALLSCRSGSWKPAKGSCESDTTTDLNNLQADGWCINGAGNANSPAGADWFFLEVYRHTNPANYYVGQRVVGMAGSAVGKVWVRTQQSGAQAGGWSAWNQISDPGVSIGGSGAGQVTATGNISTSASVNAAANVTGSYLYSSGSVVGAGTVQGSYVTSTGGMWAASSAGSPYVYSTGTMYSADSITAGTDVVSNRTALNYNGTTYNVSNGWGFVTYGDGWWNNAEPGSGRGSVYTNDVYLRSIGKYASQLSKPTFVFRNGSWCDTCNSIAYCAAGETLAGGSCYYQDVCSGNDSTQSGGYPDPGNNRFVCPGLRCASGLAYATCVQ